MSTNKSTKDSYAPKRTKRLKKEKLQGLPNNFRFGSCKTPPWTENQQGLIKSLTRRVNIDAEGKPIKTTCAFISGVAGTSKTMISIYSALKLLFEGKISKIYYVRSAVDSSPHKLGYLKGGLEEKLGVYQTPLDDKLHELLPPEVVKALMDNEYIKMESTCYLRGRNLADCAIIVDEAQNLQHEELITIISRVAEHSRIWFCFDSKQSDLSKGHKDDMSNFADIFRTPDCMENGFIHYHFTHEDIVRSKFCKFVMGKIEEWEDEKAKTSYERRNNFERQTQHQPEICLYCENKTEWSPSEDKKVVAT